MREGRKKQEKRENSEKNKKKVKKNKKKRDRVLTLFHGEYIFIFTVAQHC